MNHTPLAGGNDSQEPDAHAILEQLERILAHPAFKNSRRSQTLLRYIVEHRGESGDGHLKERTLGTEVFGREASYDTNADPVVRIAAGDIRKRITQYYHEPGHEDEIRIELPLGTYRPEIHPPVAPPSGENTHPEPAATEGAIEEPPADAMAHSTQGPRWKGYALAGVVLAVLVGFTAWRQFGRSRTPPNSPVAAVPAISQFWQPLLNAAMPVQVGVGPWPGLGAAGGPQEGAAPYVQGGTMEPVGWWDFMTAAKIVALLQKNERTFRIESAAAINLSGLSQGPSVMIGGFNNQWVIKLTRGLRFRPEEVDHHYWIIDRDEPGRKYLASPGPIPGGVLRYGLVARFLDPATGQYLVILAGVGPSATDFAGSVATNPREMEALAAQLPAAWASKNVEAIISGQVVDGQPGGPHIVAADVW